MAWGLQVFIKGHEIATHTIHHVAAPGAQRCLGSTRWLLDCAVAGGAGCGVQPVGCCAVLLLLVHIDAGLGGVVGRRAGRCTGPAPASCLMC